MPPDGENLRAERKAAGVRLTALAKAMRISVPYLWDVEHGNRGMTPAMRARHARCFAKLRAAKPNARPS